MIVSCPRCKSKYELADEKLADLEAVSLQCARCRHEFEYSPSRESESKAAAIEELDFAENETDSFDLDDLDGLLDSEDDLPAVEAEAPAEEDLPSVAAEPVSTVLAEPEPEDLSNDFPEEVSAAADGKSPVGDAFELADDFDDDLAEAAAGGDSEEGSDDFFNQADLNFDEKSPEEGGQKTAEVEELSLDLDDLDLDDIEFDSFDDPEESAVSDNDPGNVATSVRPTQLDDEGDLDNLFADQPDKIPAAAPAGKAAEAEKSEAVSVLELEPAAPPAQPSSGRLPAGRHGRPYVLVAVCFLVLSLGLWAAYGIWQRYSIDMAKNLKIAEVENRRLLLPSKRRVLTLSGRLLNNSPKEVSKLEIRGVLLDEKGQPVASKTTAGGVSFSEEELDLLDSSKISMLENAAVILPANGGELPFMLAFYDYPENASQCFVEISSFQVKKSRRF